MREVKIQLDSEQIEEINAVARNKFFEAIGYLSTWNPSYPIVEIYREAGADLIAVYRDEKNERKYVIGAVWHDDHYGFHS